MSYLYENPKTVNLDVTYTDSLPFPAVTICNKNKYKYVYVGTTYDTYIVLILEVHFTMGLKMYSICWV